jgi:hypothetical protein
MEEKSLAQNCCRTDEHKVQIELLGGLQKRWAVPPIGYEIVVYGVADQDEVHKVNHPWHDEKSRLV